MRLSYSALKTFQTCPRQFEAKYVTKTYPREDSPALRRGREVHKALEAVVKQEGEVPPSVWLPPGLMDLLHAAQAVPEYKIELTEPHFIGYLDLLVLSPANALVIDWKTGKMKRPDPLQADVYAWLLREHTMNDSLHVTFAWVGVDARKLLMIEPDLQAKNRVLDIIDTIEKTWGDWPPIESWLCRYCPLTWCEYNAAS